MIFVNSKANTSLFRWRNKEKIIYVLISVDDFIITENDLCEMFHCFDLGVLKFFLVFEISYNSKELYSLNKNMLMGFWTSLGCLIVL